MIMTTMNPVNGIRPRPSYVMPPEYTNNNYLMGAPGIFNDSLPHQGPPVHSELNLNSRGSDAAAGFQTSDEMKSLNGVYDSDCSDNVFNTSVLHGAAGANSVGIGSQNTQFTNSQVSNNLTGVQNLSGNFTFTSPTQSTFYSPLTTASTINRLSHSRMTPQAFAPTSCLQWQHTVPQRIPWSACNSMSCDQDILNFTGDSSLPLNVTFSNDQLVPVCSLPQRISPIPSCSQPPRRLKRRAPDTLSKPPNRKVHLTEDMISKHMQGLQIENVSSNTAQVDALKPRNNCTTKTGERWRKFQDIEDRLSLSDEEEESGIEGQQPRLHMVEDIGKMVAAEPVIPQNILDKISNPHMELVLWTPPGGAIKDFIEATNKSSQITESKINEAQLHDAVFGQNKCIEQLPSSLSYTMEDDTGMDIETIDDDLML